MTGGGYLPSLGEKFLTDIARWHEFGKDHFQIICMVSEIFNPACEWKELYQKFRSSSKRRMLDANFRASTAAIYVYVQAFVLWDLIRR